MTVVAQAAAATTEQEPNDTPAQANWLTQYSPMTGAIDPAGDVDYFKVKGINTNWGMVAMLDADASTASKQGVLTAYAPDGITVLQRDAGTASKKAVIAWTHFTGRDDHYLRVNASGDHQHISQYTLRYYQLPVCEQPEVEPNNTPAAANTSAITNIGAIDSAGDVDCYAFYAQTDQKFIFVLNADPEGDGGPADFALDLYRSDGTLWVSANRAGPGGNEYLDEVAIPESGVYAYCVRAVSGAGPNATYISGPIRNGQNYTASQEFALHWDNPRPGGFARVGEAMRYTLTYTHTSPLTVPGPFRLHVSYEPACQSIVDADHPDNQGADYFEWDYDELSPDMAVTKTFIMRAEAPCVDKVLVNVVLAYYVTAWGIGRDYIIGQGYYLPLVMR